ncbi:hypothetical protein VF09_37040 [Nostoc linckia z9]|nr:hypothetical protein VF09_37040 [Nostoc linckia z9]
MLYGSGIDAHALLVRADGRSVAVLSLLEDEVHGPDLAGRWHLEAGFGPLSERSGVFLSTSDASNWIRQQAEAL